MFLIVLEAKPTKFILALIACNVHASPTFVDGHLALGAIVSDVLLV